jgi:uncharacterized membrane protein YkvA (DUF1232 family)
MINTFRIISTVAYALSPIDLIPDFIPVIGYLDDLIILPLMISLSLKLIPSDIMEVSATTRNWKTVNKLLELTS